MGKILLAIWDNEASLQAQSAAIERALNNGDDLLFLYVVNIDFLRRTARRVHPRTVRDELTKLGEFLLENAVENARAQDVNAQGIIRYGTLRDELKIVAKDMEVTLVILGQPPREKNIHFPRDLPAYANQLETEVGVETLLFTHS
jgi:hypothetical protein